MMQLDEMLNDNQMKVLVVDDDPSAVVLLERIIKNAGYEVELADSAQGALRHLLQGSCQLVFLNWDMPGGNGLELVEAIREMDALPFTYVILTTSHNPTHDVIMQAFEAGIDDFLMKPVKRPDVITRLMAGSRMISLQQEVERKQREAHRFSAEMQISNSKLDTAKEQLRILAATDELTGLANRRAAMAQLHSLWSGSTRRDQTISCIMLDIDHFKSFNDTYGHDVGDLVLQATAESLRSSARECEPVFRLGGEEFLVICSQSSEEEAMVAAERFRKDIQDLTIMAAGKELKITVSLGVAERADDMEKSDELLKASDDALYAAKREGRNRSCAFSALPASETAPANA